MTKPVDKDSLPLDKPRRTPGHPTKSHVVKTKVDGREKIIRFGEQGAETAGKPKAGESERMKQKRASFKARHAKNIAKGKSSPAYWANKVKWAEGGAVKMAAGGAMRMPRVEGAALQLIEQMRRAGGQEEFNPVLVSLREQQRARPARRPQAAPLTAMQAPQMREEPLPLPPTPPAMRPDENPPPEAPPNPMRFDEGNPLVAHAVSMAERYNLPRDIFLSLIQQESRFNPNARSRVGAIGLGQLMPGTARELRVDPTDPYQNLEGSARYLRRMLDEFKDMPLALAAYNAGPGRVRRAGNTIPNIRETQNYVPSILRRAGVQQGEFAEGGLADLDQKYAEGGRVRRTLRDELRDIEAEIRGERPQSLGVTVARGMGEGGGGIAGVTRQVGRAVQAVPETPGSILTYHGSPHTFAAERLVRNPSGSTEYLVGAPNRLPDVPEGVEVVRDFPLGRFREDRIGTGEGAQVYGRGSAYLAEAEPVAETYLQGAKWSYGGRPADEIYERAYNRVSRPRARPEDNAAAYLWEQIALNKSPRSVIDDAIRNAEDWPELAAYARSLRPEDFSRVGGNMYEVRLNADPNRMLDWDAPLSAQSRAIQEIARDVDTSNAFNKTRKMLDLYRRGEEQPHNLATGSLLYRTLSNYNDDAARATSILRDAGVPGIRYLDQGSRGVGEGTRNYVVFDENLMEILRRYGLLPGAVGAGAALAAEGAEPEPEGYAEGGEVSREQKPGVLSRVRNSMYNYFIRPNDEGMQADARAKSEGMPGGASGPRDAMRHLIASSYAAPMAVTASELLQGDMLNAAVGDRRAAWDRANNALGQRMQNIPEGERYDRARDMILQQLRHIVEYGDLDNRLPVFDPNFTVVDRTPQGQEIIYGPREIINWIESREMPALSSSHTVRRGDIYEPESLGDRLNSIRRRYAEGGLAQLDQKYAEGGIVSAEAAKYDPDAVDALVKQIEAEYV